MRSILSIITSIIAGLLTIGSAQPLTEGKFTLFPRSSWSFAESTHHFDVRHYRIDLDLPMNSGAMTAHCRVELIARHDHFDTFSLHFVNLVCDSVRRDGNPCTFTTGSGRLLIDLDREFSNGESLAVDIYYRRNAGTQNRGFYYYSRGTQGIPYAICYSTTEPSDARYWFPGFDEPWDKAERGCQVNITTPDTMSGCANGTLDSVTVSGGRKTCWWTHRYPISTYLVTFAASRWARFTQWYHPAPGESVPIMNFMWPGDSSRAVNAFRNVPDMLEFFSDSSRYGPYPFAAEKYGHVVAYPFQWGGMENQTLTMVHRYWITNGNDNGIAHELSHHWWGDMVTCLDWRNIWLNEGFATYSDELFTCHQQGLNSFYTLIRSRARDYFSEESTDTHPIYAPPSGHEFDWGHSYCKGAWVQHMLRYVMGDTVWNRPGIFFSALRAYGESLKYRNASTADYQRICERITGLDLSWFFDEWVYSHGYPVYTVGWQSVPAGDSWELVIDLSQNNMSGAPAIFHMPVEVRVLFNGTDTIIRYPVSANPQRNRFRFASEPIGIEFDPNEWILDVHTVNTGIASDQAGSPLPPVPELLIRTSLTRAPVKIEYTLPRTTPLELAVFDPAGRQLTRLHHGIHGPGRFGIVWNGTDAAGRPLPAGVYLVRLSTPEAMRGARLTLLN
ncbi:MAG: M1 family aminopeptidase [candidate division WOR-3 bacterium]|nr:M1 family aminopeptidase [candidate division WOR-3 bacterium]